MQWIKNTLTAEGIVVNQKKQKYNFKRDNFLDVVASIWQTDHQMFMPGLTKVLILFALQLYLFTGARVGSFMPSNENKHEKGLRYEVRKHILGSSFIFNYESRPVVDCLLGRFEDLLVGAPLAIWAASCCAAR